MLVYTEKSLKCPKIKTCCLCSYNYNNNQRVQLIIVFYLSEQYNYIHKISHDIRYL